MEQSKKDKMKISASGLTDLLRVRCNLVDSRGMLIRLKNEQKHLYLQIRTVEENILMAEAWIDEQLKDFHQANLDSYEHIILGSLKDKNEYNTTN